MSGLLFVFLSMTKFLMNDSHITLQGPLASDMIMWMSHCVGKPGEVHIKPCLRHASKYIFSDLRHDVVYYFG